MTAPAGTCILYVQRKREDNSSYLTELDVVAFDDSGEPLVIDDYGPYSTGLVRPGDLKQVDAWWLEKTEFFSTTAAEPGWYALFAIHDEEDRELERLPIIAWRGTPNQYGGSAIIIAWDGCGTARPQDAFAYGARPENIDLVGFFHPERFPEPSDIAGYLKQLRGDYLAREQRGKESTTTAASSVTRSAV